MAVDEETMDRARASDRQAVEAVVSECFPAVHRIAHALIGEAKFAGRVVRYVLRRGVRVMPTWRRGIVPENWFFHHTLLTIRSVAPHPPPPQQDLLITAGPTEPAYTAFVRALRGLPVQQMEAFLLHQGEKLNTRLLGVAMDLSTQAATAHLAAATNTLQTIAGDQFASLTAALERVYTGLTPPQTVVRTMANQEIRSVFWRRLIRRVIRRLIFLGIFAALAFAGWHWRQLILRQYHEIRQRMN
jgi:DNA-directed RNA polymerase specialized sigma24 family protein